MRIIVALFFVAFTKVAAQSPQVPHKMEFAGITLTIRDDARREIQKDVDALTASSKHYNIKAERAKTYFPIIEKILKEESVPDDFKYLVLQESALIPDAVSVSNAVGFWQFKDFTAMEMGLRVDKQIDERMNIVSSTRAAARYLTKNNGMFDNWIYALQSYQMGAGGVMKSVNDTKPGTKHMEITSQTYWYVKKFLSYKVAFEEGVRGEPQAQVIQYENRNSKTLADIAREVAVQEEELKSFNKWARSGSIPGDRPYVVLIPVPSTVSPITYQNSIAKNTQAAEASKSVVAASAKSVHGKINGIKTIQALSGENSAKLAARAGVELGKFLSWNDITISDPIVEGQFYFLGKKRSRAIENFHKVGAGEDLWQISQRYGIQLKRLKKFNRLQQNIDPTPGTMLWLASMRPKNDRVIQASTRTVEVNDSETFNWAVQPASENEIVRIDSTTIIQQPASDIVREMPPKSTDSSRSLAPAINIIVKPDTMTSIPVTVLPAEKKEHVVQAGETLYAISKIYDVTVMNLVHWNDLNLQQGLKPGQVLKLFDANAKTDEKVQSVQNQLFIHEVKNSDTLYSIARQYNVTIKELMEWNEKKDFSLSVGEKLKIMQGK